MKTKIRTLAAICILGFIGTINVNAANYKNLQQTVQSLKLNWQKRKLKFSCCNRKNFF